MTNDQQSGQPGNTESTGSAESPSVAGVKDAVSNVGGEVKTAVEEFIPTLEAKLDQALHAVGDCLKHVTAHYIDLAQAKIKSIVGGVIGPKAQGGDTGGKPSESGGDTTAS